MIGLGLSVTQLAVRGLRLTDLAAAIRSLFAAGEQGVWYDPSDITRYTDQFGPELITNGTFDSGTTGWEAGTLAALSVSSNVLRITGTGNNWQLARQTFSGLVIGKVYRVSVDLKGTSGVTNSYVAIDNVVDKTSQGATAKTIAFDFTATATSHAISLGLSQVVASGDWVEFDNVSIREYSVLVTSGTLYQDAAGTIPVTAVEQPVGLMLDKSKGLVLGPELVSNPGPFVATSGWTAYSSVLSVNSGSLVVTGNNAGYPAARATITTVVGVTYKLRFVVSQLSSGNSTDIWIGTTAGGANLLQKFVSIPSEIVAYFTATGTTTHIQIANNLQTASDSAAVGIISVRELPGNHAYQTTTVNRPVLSGRYNRYVGTETLSSQSVTTLAANYTLSFSGTGSITLSGTATGTYSAGTHTITCAAGTLTSTVSGTVTKADLRVANDGVGLPPYQRVNTSTDYDTVVFPLYLSFNGSNQWMRTNAIDFSATDKMTVFAGVRKLSDSVSAIAEISDVNNDFAFSLLNNQYENRSGSYSPSGHGTYGNSGGLLSFPVTNIQSVSFSANGTVAADFISARVNGVQKTYTPDAFLAASGKKYSNSPLYLGARDGTALWFNGRLYQLVVRGAQSTAQQITDAETYINSKTKAYA